MGTAHIWRGSHFGAKREALASAGIVEDMVAYREAWKTLKDIRDPSRTHMSPSMSLMDSSVSWSLYMFYYKCRTCMHPTHTAAGCRRCVLPVT